MKRITVFFVLFFLNISAQEKTFKTEEISVNELVTGTLYTPNNSEKTNLVILIAGSGPTDRDGNQAMMKNNSLKFLAEGLSENGISVYSFDKRMFAMLKTGNLDESKMLFTDYINDVVDIVSFFRKENKFNKIIVAGHSEGSLIGMVASEKAKADGFVSIAGAGNSIDKVLEFQIEQNAPFLLEESKKILTELKKGNTTELKNNMLYSLFRPSVQPYMISWIAFNPQEEIKKLSIPVMIVNGTSDLQVLVSEAELLHKAKPDSQYLIIEQMNHVLKQVKDLKENQKSYSDPNIPIVSELVQKMSSFVNQIN